MTFGEFLKRRRKEKGISLKELSHKCGLSISYLNEIEKGAKRPPKSKVVNNIVASLRLGYDDKCYMYDLAAKERGEVSADLVEYIMSNDDVRAALRAAKETLEENKT